MRNFGVGHGQQTTIVRFIDTMHSDFVLGYLGSIDILQPRSRPFVSIGDFTPLDARFRSPHSTIKETCIIAC